MSTIPCGYDVTNYYFFGGAYEVETNGATTTTTRYYAIGGQTVAMYDGTNLRYLITDHLGSVIAVANASGGLVSQQRFSIPFGDLPFGQLRGTTPITQTDLGYTGQRAIDAQNTQYSLGLMDYRARFYAPLLMRFSQPDTVTLGGTQGLNRFSYTANNPINSTDPSGHIGQTHFNFQGLRAGNRYPNRPASV